MSETIHTGDGNWLQRVAQAYKARRPVVIVDDAQTGFDPNVQTLMQFARDAKLSTREVAGLAVSLGMSAAGVAMVVLAFVDPEPTSKLGLLVAGGCVCVLGGGFQAVQILTRQKPPRVKVTPRGIEICWD